MVGSAGIGLGSVRVVEPDADHTFIDLVVNLNLFNVLDLRLLRCSTTLLGHSFTFISDPSLYSEGKIFFTKLPAPLGVGFLVEIHLPVEQHVGVIVVGTSETFLGYLGGILVRHLAIIEAVPPTILKGFDVCKVVATISTTSIFIQYVYPDGSRWRTISRPTLHPNGTPSPIDHIPRYVPPCSP